jgi:hypothetical protein
MDSTAGTGENLGTRVLRQAVGTGQVVQASWRGQLGQGNTGRTGMVGKIQQDG